MRQILSVALLAGILFVPAFAQDSCGFLHKQTQAFSDAGQRGDGAAMAKLLDRDVIFFNETGEKATRADMAGATPPATGTPIRTITTTDWACKVYGDVAVTSFVDVLEQGKPGEMKFRSVETWRQTSGAWKMIGSETLSLQQDPEPMVLDDKALDEYAGSYEARREHEIHLRAQRRRTGCIAQRQCRDGAEGAGARHLLYAGTWHDA
jgi:ketosteroid isomerase-like protein